MGDEMIRRTLVGGLICLILSWVLMLMAVGVRTDIDSEYRSQINTKVNHIEAFFENFI